ncbi:hypothetical protein ACIGB8_14510 [Promicromonospora sukumoe]|uniref:hypothetical protein n=1 Tax=Promicromonospora sukumoe TaxID=88382 RepID=UPI0037C7EB2E
MPEGEWTPGIDANGRALRGLSAWSLLGLIVWGSNLGLVLMAILVAGMLIRGSGYGGSPFLTGVMALVLLDVLYLLIVVIWSSVRKRRELRAGYTTVTNQYPDVDQVDPSTGHAVRLAGEEPLSRPEYLRRISLIREVLDTKGSG